MMDFQPDTSEETQAVANRINQRMQQAVEAIVAVGAELLAAKERLPHGEFGRLFKSHPDAIAHPVRFSRRTAEVLMTIARHPVLTHAQHVAHLPPSWGTLGVLARLAPPALEAMLADGRVTPELERRDADRLVADGGDDHEVAQLAGLVDLRTMSWAHARLMRGAAALREKADELERRAATQQPPASEGALLASQQRLARLLEADFCDAKSRGEASAKMNDRRWRFRRLHPDGEHALARLDGARVDG